MDTLVALGSSTAFGFSVWTLFSGSMGHLYFLESAAILTLISLGHWLEVRASQRAASTLRVLLNLSPRTARRISPGSAESLVPVRELVVGDLVLLKPGDQVPTDGEVVDGRSAVDESMLTGESAPVEKCPGSPLYGGTVNPERRLVMRVTETGEGTALARIIAAVERAQNSRARIQRIGDRVSSVFVPVVVVVALATGLWWGFAYETATQVATSLAEHLWPAVVPGGALAAAFIHAAAVLIVACPCAMGLATPTAIMAGANAAARRGILIRDGIALEKSGSITTVLFDKTGTLTQGRPVVTDVVDLRQEPDSMIRLEDIATGLAKPSDHPLSNAIARLHEDSPRQSTPNGQRTSPADRAVRLDWSNWREVRGCGVVAEQEGRTWRMGALPWLQNFGVSVAPAERFVVAAASSGATVLGVAVDAKLAGTLTLRDALKSDARVVIAKLMRQGKRVCMVTGDREAVAAAIAKSVGIDAENVFAEVAPDNKATIVRKLQEQGERVAFVGDGINDAPALEQANLGMAVSRSSDIAREAADIVLLRSDLGAVPEALGLARATLRAIKQNLFWAFFYNAMAVPLAALGFLSPILCAATMGLSDLLVIGNALRLNLCHHLLTSRGRFGWPGPRAGSKTGA